MTIIVTGGRDYKDRDKVFTELEKLKPTLIIEGGASGADRLAQRWAIASQIPFITYEADWDQHGKLAGPMRNRKMLTENPHATVLAFPGDKGTANCVSTALALKMTVIKVV